MNAKEISEISGVTVRTLHHYDCLGLLCPHRNPDNGYRMYSDADVDLLQQILFFKECGFPLKKIKELLSKPDFDREKAFELQKKYLLHEKNRIESMLITLEKSIENMKGKTKMSSNEKFAGFDFSNNPYEEEARSLWGDEVVDKSNAKVQGMTKSEKDRFTNGMGDIFIELAKVRYESPDSEAAQKAVAKMYKFFNGSFGYHYSPQAFAGLGQMYVDDKRFTENIDKFGSGLSAFLAKAMKIYAESL